MNKKEKVKRVAEDFPEAKELLKNKNLPRSVRESLEQYVRGEYD